MSELQPLHGRGFHVERDRPLIGIPVPNGDDDTIEYFTDEDAVEAATPRASIRRALSQLDAWKDIDSDDALDQLDRIRHESKPTPPIDL